MPDYIGVPIETDPETIAGDVYEFIQDRIPGWLPHAGNLEVIIIEALSRRAAETRDLASRVPTSIFRYFGSSIIGLPPVDAQEAFVEATFTMIDDQGYTLPAGSLVGIASSGDTLVAFETISDVTVTPGNTVAPDVALRAVLAGSSGSNLGGIGETATMIDPYAFVETVVLEGVTTGGTDAETDVEYLSRLVEELQLMAPRPILPRDFEVMARRVGGVYRAVALDGYFPGRNEVQRITVTGAPTGGNFTLTWNGQTTGVIAWNANVATVLAALEALSNIAPGDVVVTGGPFPATAMDVQFTGTKAAADQPLMTLAVNSLTGGAAPTVTFTTPTIGLPPATNQERMISIAAMDETGVGVSPLVKTEIDTMFEAKREVNFEIHVIDPTVNLIDVIFQVVAHKDYDLAIAAANAEQAAEDFLDPLAWGRISQPGIEFDPRQWSNETHVRFNDLLAAIDRADGVRYVDTMQIGFDGGAMGTADLTLVGAVPITGAADVNGTAVYE